jgi:hypothetical protein
MDEGIDLFEDQRPVIQKMKMEIVEILMPHNKEYNYLLGLVALLETVQPLLNRIESIGIKQGGPQWEIGKNMLRELFKQTFKDTDIFCVRDFKK